MGHGEMILFRVTSLHAPTLLQASLHCTSVWVLSRARKGSFEGRINTMFIHVTAKSCFTLNPNQLRLIRACKINNSNLLCHGVCNLCSMITHSVSTWVYGRNIAKHCDLLALVHACHIHSYLKLQSSLPPLKASPSQVL